MIWSITKVEISPSGDSFERGICFIQSEELAKSMLEALLYINRGNPNVDYCLSAGQKEMGLESGDYDFFLALISLIRSYANDQELGTQVRKLYVAHADHISI